MNQQKIMWDVLISGFESFRHRFFTMSMSNFKFSRRRATLSEHLLDVSWVGLRRHCRTTHESSEDGTDSTQVYAREHHRTC